MTESNEAPLQFWDKLFRDGEVVTCSKYLASQLGACPLQLVFWAKSSLN